MPDNKNGKCISAHFSFENAKSAWIYINNVRKFSQSKFEVFTLEIFEQRSEIYCDTIKYVRISMWFYHWNLRTKRFAFFIVRILFILKFMYHKISGCTVTERCDVSKFVLFYDEIFKVSFTFGKSCKNLFQGFSNVR